MILGLGVDVIEHERVARVLERHGPAFLARVFTADEIAEGERLHRGVAGWAARFAAKEAVFKALGGEQTMLWHEIIVLYRQRPLPEVTLGPQFAAALQRRHGVATGRWHLSLSHSRQTAVAVAIYETLP